MKLYLVRHGQSTANKDNIIQGHNDTHLTDLGREQAQKIALRLKDVKFTKIYCSDLRRAQDTAKAIREYHKEVPYVEDARLRELSRGDYEGLEYHKVKGWKERTLDQLINFTPPRGENFNDAILRVRDFLKDMDREGTILIVAHGGPIKAILHVLHGYSKEYLYSEYPNKNSNLNIIDFSGDKPVHELKGCTKHLED